MYEPVFSPFPPARRGTNRTVALIVLAVIGAFVGRIVFVATSWKSAHPAAVAMAVPVETPEPALPLLNGPVSFLPTVAQRETGERLQRTGVESATFVSCCQDGSVFWVARYRGGDVWGFVIDADGRLEKMILILAPPTPQPTGV